MIAPEHSALGQQDEQAPQYGNTNYVAVRIYKAVSPFSITFHDYNIGVGCLSWFLFSFSFNLECRVSISKYL